jgi:uncharacterized protein (DUF3084 family)
MTTIAVADLTQATLEGTGVFDVLMRANKAHLEAEFSKNRIKGAEYATVYLGSLTQVMQTALQFLLTKEKADLEAQLLQKQILLAQKEIDKATVEIAQITAQTELVNQQKANLIAEAANIPKQGLVLEAQKLQIVQQTTNLLAESLNIPKQGLLIDANKAQVTQQTENLVSQKAQVIAQTELVVQQKANAIIEGTVLVAQECKLRAEFDLITSNTVKSAQETALLTQKVATERAQVTAMGVDDNSVVGKQKLLYQAQTDGFKRDAEQKAAKLMIDTWNVRRTTDSDNTAATGTNRLSDVDVGSAVAKMLTGVGA